MESNAATAGVSPMLAELRERTRELHTRAERHPVQAAMVRGQSGVGGYTAYLGQMWHIHEALESELGRRLEGSAALGARHAGAVPGGCDRGGPRVV
ncbi:MAG: hypothetical protein HND58_06190 [Planctomycetota bacterium]|nr:MAG: hypothetical protein HND58_06190 [Planctomycetota bacterium]